MFKQIMPFTLNASPNEKSVSNTSLRSFVQIHLFTIGSERS